MNSILGISLINLEKLKEKIPTLNPQKLKKSHMTILAKNVIRKKHVSGIANSKK